MCAKKGGSGGGGKKDKKAAATSPASQDHDLADEDDGSGGGNHPHANPADPFNFADVESRWQRSEVHYEDKFKELRRALGGGGGSGAHGEGAVDVDAIGDTPVTIRGEGEGDVAAAPSGKRGHGHAHGHPHGHGHEAAAEAAAATTTTVPLSQLALIIPRAGGRVVELRMHSPASRKAIVSAVQTNPLFNGQQPQPDANDELVLLVKMGGSAAGATGAPSGGSGGSKAKANAMSAAEAAAAERTRRVHDLANAWRAQIRRATARRQKTHQTWKKEAAVRPDDLHRLDRDLLKGQEKRMGKIDAAEKEMLRQLERVNRR